MNHIAISYYYQAFKIEKTLMSDKALKGILVAPQQVKRALQTTCTLGKLVLFKVVVNSHYSLIDKQVGFEIKG